MKVFSYTWIDGRMVGNNYDQPYSIQSMLLQALEDNVILYVDNDKSAYAVLQDIHDLGFRVADKGVHTYSILVSAKRQFYAIDIRVAPKRVLHVYAIGNMVSLSDADEIRRTFGGSTKTETMHNIANELEHFNIRGVSAGSAAMKQYRDMIGYGNFSKQFPWNDMYSGDIRQAYRGAIIYARPDVDRDYGSGFALDCNSLYPYELSSQPMPYDDPIAYEGEYVHDDQYPYHVDRITFRADLKKHGVPFLSSLIFPWLTESQYVTSTHGFVTMWLTDVDWNNVCQQYDAYAVNVECGYKFKAKRGMFSQYVTKWSYVKSSSRDAERSLAKLMINSIIGKFGAYPRDTRLMPSWDENNGINWNMVNNDNPRNPVAYPPVAMWVTALARQTLLAVMSANHDRVICADTDSVFLLGSDKALGVEEHPTKLGAWKRQHDFSKIRILGARKYLLQEKTGELAMCLSGVATDHPYSFEEFKAGNRLVDAHGHTFVL